ncbi:hypothetical protein HPP92_024652 [Vanilla planifolia]|uniref:Uncharacterized protein n=1 Tax=Vanilla planifolia TaxID=51239 RepID=A0A835UBI7_VANPL|nr:hypothetical protein HPP92_024652 [Vanilla planifolia]
MGDKQKEKGGGERWKAAILNLSEMSANLESLQKILSRKAVFVDEETFSKASLITEQARNIKALEQRVETLERELDAAISSAAHARSEKRLAEAAQRAAELCTQNVTKELENTTKVFELHMEELRAKQEEISKKDKDIKLLEAIIQTLSRNGSRFLIRGESATSPSHGYEVRKQSLQFDLQQTHYLLSKEWVVGLAAEGARVLWATFLGVAKLQNLQMTIRSLLLIHLQHQLTVANSFLLASQGALQTITSEQMARTLGILLQTDLQPRCMLLQEAVPPSITFLAMTSDGWHPVGAVVII